MIEQTEKILTLINKFKEVDDITILKGVLHYLKHDVLALCLMKLINTHSKETTETFIKNASVVMKMLNDYDELL